MVGTTGVPSPQGLASCTFDNTTLGGPLVAVGNLNNAGVVWSNLTSDQCLNIEIVFM